MVACDERQLGFGATDRLTCQPGGRGAPGAAERAGAGDGCAVLADASLRIQSCRESPLASKEDSVLARPVVPRTAGRAKAAAGRAGIQPEAAVAARREEACAGTLAATQRSRS